MTFANPLYYSITNNFFDYLSNNINKAFEKRCEELYYKNRALGEIKKGKVESQAAPKTEKIVSLVSPTVTPVLEKEQIII